MKKNFLFILISLLFSFSKSAFAHDYLITSGRAGDIKLGMSYQDFIKKYPKAFQVNGHCNSDEPKGLSVLDYVLVYDKNCNRTKLIKEINIYSEKFKTNKERFKIGTNISDILKIYPKIKLKKDTLSQEEYFEINDKNMTIDLFVRKNNSNNFFDLLGTYEGFSPSESIAKNFSRNGKIDYIKIYLNENKDISNKSENKEIIKNTNNNSNIKKNEVDTVNLDINDNTKSQKVFKSIVFETNIKSSISMDNLLSVSPGVGIGGNYYLNENFSVYLETSLFFGKGFSSYFIPITLRFNNELFNSFSFYTGLGAFFVPGLSIGSIFEAGIYTPINNDYKFVLGIDYGLGLSPTMSKTFGIKGGFTKAL